MESPSKLRERIWEYLSKVSLGLERGFKILPGNDAKMLSHGLYLGKIPTQFMKVRQLREYLPTITLYRHSPNFSDDETTTRGES
jgi:hypothetical protein